MKSKSRLNRKSTPRRKMAIDLLFMHDPHFLGEKIEI
jgi:hypothetical protein